MQGQSRMDRELLDAGEMAGHLVPPGSVFAFLAEHRRELFPDSADLREMLGRVCGTRSRGGTGEKRARTVMGGEERFDGAAQGRIVGTFAIEKRGALIRGQIAGAHENVFHARAR